MMDQQRVIGNEVNVTFVSLSNRKLLGKVDTGATTSSLHATNIHVDGNRVSFVCPDISSNSITMELAGSQEVHSADGGGQARPIVKFDIQVNGQSMSGVSFNLNDRSNMDDPVLIGQNVLQAGGFIIDVNQDQQPVGEAVEEDDSSFEDDFQNPPDDLKQAIQTILSYNIPIHRFAQLLVNAESTKE